MPKTTPREISGREWATAIECVVGSGNIIYHVPTIAALDAVLVAVTSRIVRAQRSGKLLNMLPGWCEDRDRLIDRRLWYSMLPADGAPIDG